MNVRLIKGYSLNANFKFEKVSDNLLRHNFSIALM